METEISVRVDPYEVLNNMRESEQAEFLLPPNFIQNKE